MFQTKKTLIFGKMLVRPAMLIILFGCGEMTGDSGGKISSAGSDISRETTGGSTESMTGLGPPSTAAAKLQIDTAPPSSGQTTNVHIATITGYKDNNVTYWGTKDSSGKPTKITQSLTWQTDPTKGVRTFFDDQGLPIYLKDEANGNLTAITWEATKATFKYYDKSGKYLGGKVVTQNGSSFVVTDITAVAKATDIPTLMAMPNWPMVTGSSFAIAIMRTTDRYLFSDAIAYADWPFARNLIQTFAAGLATYGVVPVALAPLFGASVAVAAIPTVVGVVTYYLFSDAIINAGTAVNTFVSSLPYIGTNTTSSTQLNSWEPPSTTTTDPYPGITPDTNTPASGTTGGSTGGDTGGETTRACLVSYLGHNLDCSSDSVYDELGADVCELSGGKVVSKCPASELIGICTDKIGQEKWYYQYYEHWGANAQESCQAPDTWSTSP